MSDEALGIVLCIASVVHANARTGGPSPIEVREYATVIASQLGNQPKAREVVNAFARHLGASAGA